MNDLLFNIWLILGISCILIEFLIPGLVIIFIGLGALSVNLGLYLELINGLEQQLLTFFISSTIYLVTLRFLVLRLFPSKFKKPNIDEDEVLKGVIVEVCEEITPTKAGRVIHSESTWKAKSFTNTSFKIGDKAKIVGRDNITLIVDKI